MVASQQRSEKTWSASVLCTLLGNAQITVLKVHYSHKFILLTSLLYYFSFNFGLFNHQCPTVLRAITLVTVLSLLVVHVHVPWPRAVPLS